MVWACPTDFGYLEDPTTAASIRHGPLRRPHDLLFTNPFGRLLQLSHSGGKVFEFLPGDHVVAFVAGIDVRLLEQIETTLL